MIKKVFLSIIMAFTIIMVISINLVIGLDYKIKYHDVRLKQFTSGEISSQEIGDINTVAIQVNSNVDDFVYPCTLSKDSSYEDVQAYKRAHRANARKYYTSQNILVASSMKVEGFFERYVSKYSPIIEYNFDIDSFTSSFNDILNNISSNGKVETVDVYGYGGSRNITSNLSYSSSVCEFEDVYINRNYTGEGVNVGLLEDSIMDETHVNIAGSDYLIRDEWYYVESVHPHTTKMASIIGGNNGIAIGAKILNAELFNLPTGEVEWMLDNDVDVVNMSFGFECDYGIYDDLSAYFDYISMQYGVTFIASTGNNENGEYLVTNPALGYNVIAVGGSINGNQYYGPTNTEVISGTFKPNIIAPAKSIAVPNYSATVEGTSAACAITTGVVAALMEKHPYLKVRPDMVMAILNSGASYLHLGLDEFLENGYSNYSGAGRLNYQNSEGDYRVFALSLTSDPTSSTYPYIHEECEMMYEGERLTISVAALATATGTAEDTKWPGIGIYVFKQGDLNNILKGVYSDQSNVQYINYVIPEDGYYVIQVMHHRQTELTYPFDFAFSWHIE